MIETSSFRRKLLQLAIRGSLTRRSCGMALQFIVEAMSSGGVADRCPITDQPYQLPDGWEWCRLCEIAYVASGSTPPKSCFVEDGIPYLKMYNLRNQQIDFEYRPQYISRETHNGKLSRSRAEPGDLIMNIVGPPLGKLAIVPTTLPQCNFNQAAVMIRPYLEKDTLGKYLYYYLWEMGEINSLETKGTAGQDNISLTQCRNLRIALPPLAEQKAIVKRLEELLALEREIAADSAALDDLITAAKRKILDLAISGKLMPKRGDWKTVKLGDIALVSGGTTPKGGLLAETGIPYFKIAEMNLPGNEKYLIHTGVYVSKLSGVKTFPKGSIVFPKNGGALLTNKKRILGQESVCDLNTGAVILKDTTLLDWVYLWFQTIDFSDYVSGGVIPTFNGSTLKALSLPLPTLAEQKAIVKRVEELFAVLDAMKGAK